MLDVQENVIDDKVMYLKTVRLTDRQNQVTGNVIQAIKLPVLLSSLSSKVLKPFWAKCLQMDLPVTGLVGLGFCIFAFYLQLQPFIVSMQDLSHCQAFRSKLDGNLSRKVRLNSTGRRC